MVIMTSSPSSTRRRARSAIIVRAGTFALASWLLFAACTNDRRAPLVPLVVRVAQAQTTPTFTHAVLKIYRDEGGKPTSFVKATECATVSSLPTGNSGRRRLELAVDEGGPYYLQFTGHNDASCSPGGAVAAALVPGLFARTGPAELVPITAMPIDRFAVAAPPEGLTGAEIVARAFHTATLAADGTLLLAGGAQELTPLPAGACANQLGRCFRLARATSGIHALDPGTGAQVLAGALSDRRFLHSASLLAGTGMGRLVVAGGAQSVTLGGAGGGADTPFVRPDATCTNPNDASGAGCILRSIELHKLDGSSPEVVSMQRGRAGHAAFLLAAGKLLVAGGRTANLQPGCTNDAQCAAGAVCDVRGRCLKEGRDCAQFTTVTDICPPGYSCENGADGNRCVQRGCKKDDDCGGCLASGGCSTGQQSVCDVGTGTCTKRGCSSDSECLGSNRRCVEGNCVQTGCDGLSGCPGGTACDVRTGKCRPTGVTADCSPDGSPCDCRSNADCAAGFACQTQPPLTGRCRNVQTGCPATVCRRDESDPAQGPYFDQSGNLRRDVNCQAGQCVLRGCLGDVDCPAGFLCEARVCVSGRRVTGPSAGVELCAIDRGGGSCEPVADMTTTREGAAAACLARGEGAACDRVLLWGGNTSGETPGEVRGASGELVGTVSIAGGCAASGTCTPSLATLVEDAQGVLVLGGVAMGSGGAYQFLSTTLRVASASSSVAQVLSARLASGRAAGAGVVANEGVLLIGGVGAGLGTAQATGFVSAAGDRYEEPEALRLNTARFGHTATVLPDGRIVVVGGIDPAAPAVLSSIELLVPRSALR
jgi:hypothetical protein